MPTFYLNGTPLETQCAPGTSLLTLLRQQGCASVHRVCESGDCGGCTVWVNDEPVHSCLYPAQRLAEDRVTTLEGLTDGAQLHPMQQAFLQEQGFQCGYCTPGMILSAEKLIGTTEPEIRAAMDGNLCRCTGYQAIVASILAGKATKAPAPVTPAPAQDAAAPYAQVGQSIPKQDGPEIVTGQPVYTDDWEPADTLHLKVLRSPHAHALIRAIETTAARAIPGVVAIFTHTDVPRKPYTTAGHGEPIPDPHDHYLLDHKVRFVGDRVAAVVAETLEIAERACQLIQVEYDILPPVFDPLDALGDLTSTVWPYGTAPPPHRPTTPPLLHDEPDSFQIEDPTHNLMATVQLEEGAIEQGFADADGIVERIYTLPATQHFHLEPHIAVTWLEPDGTLTARVATQVPFYSRRRLSQLFDLPEDKVRVYKPKLGGGFGNKQEIFCEDLCALATLRTGRPVKWAFTRQEEFTATTSRHAMRIYVKVGAKRDGTLTAMEMCTLANAGAYGNHSGQVIYLTGCFPLGLYRCSHQRYRGYAVYTNTMPGGAFRGYGATQGTFALETALDELAHQLNLDPVDLRHRHLITPSEAMVLGQRDHFHVIGSCCTQQALEQVTQALGYTPGHPPQVNGHCRRGMGFAVSMQASGLAKIHLATVSLSLKPDGRYEMRTGAVDVGTGSDTTLRQIAAEVLNTQVTHIDLIAADTRHTPFDGGSYASATLFISGQATRLAAEALKAQLLEAASHILQVPTDNLTLSGDTVVLSEFQIPNSKFQIPFPLSTLAHQANLLNIPLTAEREYATDYASLTFAVLGAEVEVDTETGRITPLRLVQALDLGKAINPKICEGQAVGGLVMGLGYALQEELHWNDQGQILNPSPRTYRLPIAREIPPIEVRLLETSDPYGPYGAKGIGEITTNCAAPAIANAVAHATGVRLTQLPMTPERVWRALYSGVPS
jgi:putative selenate reductase molybdopterin-binding subunit